jgi:predicted RNA-binding Zn-ribbon protein involved in translation (DUF1610 family)
MIMKKIKIPEPCANCNDYKIDKCEKCKRLSDWLEGDNNCLWVDENDDE